MYRYDVEVPIHGASAVRRFAHGCKEASIVFKSVANLGAVWQVHFFNMLDLKLIQTYF